MRPTRRFERLGDALLEGAGPRLLPRLSRRAMMGLANAVGSAVFRSDFAEHALYLDELTRTLPRDVWPDSPEGIVRRAWQTRAFDAAEQVALRHTDPKQLAHWVVTQGAEHLQDALSKKSGAVVIAARFGPRHMLVPGLLPLGVTPHELTYKPPGPDADARSTRRQRWCEVQEKAGGASIEVLRFLRPAYRVLEQNQVVVGDFDEGPGPRWVQVKVGMRTANVPTLPWQIARRTGAPVVPAVLVRHPRQALHQLWLHTPLKVRVTDDEDADVRVAAEGYARWFDRWVERRPDHWLPVLVRRRLGRQDEPKALFDDWPQEGP